MVEIRSENGRLWAAKSLGRSRSAPAHGVFCDRKRCGSRQETVTAELRSSGTMYRIGLVSTTGTRLSWPFSVADRGQKPRCILLYRTVVRNGGGIPLSVFCPLFFCRYDTLSTGSVRYRLNPVNMCYSSPRRSYSSSLSHSQPKMSVDGIVARRRTAVK